MGLGMDDVLRQLLPERPPATMDEYREVTLDLATLTMGEIARAEVASGMTLQQLLASPMAKKLMAVFVHELRNYVKPRSWQELSNLRLLDGSSSISHPSPDGVSETSKL